MARLASLLFALLLGGPVWAQQVAFDNFERSFLGSNWTDLTIDNGSGDADCTIIGSSDASSDNTPNNGGAWCHWNADTLAADNQYACIRLSGTTAGADSFTQACLAMSSTGGGEAVCCGRIVGGGFTWQMNSYLSGMFDANDDGGTDTINSGDYIGIQRTSATNFRCFRSTTGDAWTAMGTLQFLGTSWANPGAGGIGTQNQDLNVEQWEMGNGVLPTTHVCGVAAAAETTTTTTVVTTSTVTTTSTTVVTTSTTSTTAVTTSTTSTTSSSSTSTTSTTSSTTTSVTSVMETTTTTLLIPNGTDVPPPQERTNESGTQYFPNRLRTGPTMFADLDRHTPAGAFTYCWDCVPGSSPCIQGCCGAQATRLSAVQGVIEPDVSFWSCGDGNLLPGGVCPDGQVVVGFGPGGTVFCQPLCEAQTCPEGFVVTGQSDTCGFICECPLGEGSSCPAGEVVVGIDCFGQVICTVPPTTTTTTTTTSSTVTTDTGVTTTSTSSTTTTTLAFAGIVCKTWDPMTPAVTAQDFFFAPRTLEIQSVGCYCQGTCSTAATYRFTDRDDNPIGFVSGTSVSCATGTTDVTFKNFNLADPDTDLVQGEGLRVVIANSPTSLNDKVTICVTWKE